MGSWLIAAPHMESIKSTSEAAFLAGGMGQTRSQSKAQHSALTPPNSWDPWAGIAALGDVGPGKGKN